MASALLVDLGAAGRIIAADVESTRLTSLEGAVVLSVHAPDLLARVELLDADLVVLPGSRTDLALTLADAGRRTIVADAHDFDDGYALWRELGGRVGLGARMHEIIRERALPLGLLSAESYGEARPRIAAIASVEPLSIVGGHDFVAGLIERAGGENVLHDHSVPVLEVDIAELCAFDPALLVHSGPVELDARQRQLVLDAVGGVAPVVFITFDRDLFFVAETLATVRLLRERILGLRADSAEWPASGRARPDRCVRGLTPRPEAVERS